MLFKDVLIDGQARLAGIETPLIAETMVKQARPAQGGMLARMLFHHVVPEEKKIGFPILQLFNEGRAWGTVLLWIINFMNLLNLYTHEKHIQFLIDRVTEIAQTLGRPTA